MPECVDSTAPEEICCICGKIVKTCESEEPVDTSDGIFYVCPVHPDCVQMSDGRWVCSDECWCKAVGV